MYHGNSVIYALHANFKFGGSGYIEVNLSLFFVLILDNKISDYYCLACEFVSITSINVFLLTCTTYL